MSGGKAVNEQGLLQHDGEDGPENRFGGRRNVARVHERVREAIVTGELPAEAALSQVRLAEQLGVSRAPLREALRLLEREGLVESEVNRRVRVTPLSVSDLEQLYAMRIQLEALGVRLTVPRLGNEDLASLEECLAGMDGFARAENYGGWEVPHRAFHAALVAYAGDRLRGTISYLWDHAERYRRARHRRALVAQESSRAWNESMAEHRRIFEVCREGDPIAASERLARHYSVTALSLLAEMAPEREPLAVRTALRMVMRT